MHLLYVEDDPDLRDLLSLCFDDEPELELTLAADGGEALRLARSTRFDAAVLDAGLPDMGGAELADRLRAGPGGGGLRVFFCTGRCLQRELESLERCAPEAIFVKPVDLGEITRRLLADPRAAAGRIEGGAPSAAEAAGRRGRSGAIRASMPAALTRS